MHHYPIMIVDDNKIFSQIISKLLHSLGYEIIIANSGKDAIGKLKNKKPKVMLIDIGMPLMDGYELARNIKKDENLSEIILIAYTGRCKREDKLKARRAGFHHYIKKASTIAEFRVILNAYEYL